MIAETQVKYDGNRLIPAPFLSISRSDTITAEGDKLGAAFTLIIQGKMLTWKGSPRKDGSWFTSDGYPADETITEGERLAAILHKQDAIRKLFSTQGKQLIIQPGDASSPLYCNPTVQSVEFAEGPWTDTCDYTITLLADKLYASVTGLQDNSGDSFINSANEQWALAPGPVTGTFTVNHNINAVGRPVYTTGGTLTRTGWMSAKLWASGRAGYDTGSIPSSLLLLTGVSPYNPVREENWDETEGSYALTEQWILAPTSAFENYNASYEITLDDGFATVNVNLRGNVQGLYTNLNEQSVRNTNAATYFSSTVLPNIYTRAGLVFPSTTLNTNPTVKTVDFNFNEGTVDYTFGYNDGAFTSGTQEEYSIEVTRGQDAFIEASIEGTIFGRLLQGEHTTSLRFGRAVAQWSVVEPLLYSRVSGYVSGLKTSPLTKNISRNPIQGTVGYSATFNNRDYNNYLDNYTTALRFDSTNGRKTVAVNGQVVGLITAESGGWNNKYQNAQSGWAVVSTSLYLRASSLLATLQTKPNSVSYEENPREGTISYAYEYNDRPQNLWHEDYAIQFNTTRTDGVSTCSVQGTINGIMDSGDSETDKYNYARSGFSSVSGLLYSRATSFVGAFYPAVTGLTSSAVTVAIGANPQAGTINYAYEYNDIPLPTVTGALFQSVNIQDVWARDLFAQFPIPFNSGGGPALQDLQAKTEKRRVATIEIVMRVGSDKPNRTEVDALIPALTGVKYIDDNTEVWSSSTGRYTRTISWVYTTTGYY